MEPPEPPEGLRELGRRALRGLKRGRALADAAHDEFAADPVAFGERLRELRVARDRIPDGTVSPAPEALWCPASREWRDAISRREEAAQAQLEKLNEFDLLADSAVIECRRCAGRGEVANDVAWVQRQLRSGDEGATTVCTCRRCGQVWRQ